MHNLLKYRFKVGTSTMFQGNNFKKYTHFQKPADII